MTAEARRALVEAPFPVMHWLPVKRWAGTLRRTSSQQGKDHEPILRTAVSPTYYAEEAGEWAVSQRHSANPWFSRRSFTVYANEFAEDVR